MFGSTETNGNRIKAFGPFFRIIDTLYLAEETISNESQSPSLLGFLEGGDPTKESHMNKHFFIPSICLKKETNRSHRSLALPWLADTPGRNGHQGESDSSKRTRVVF